MKIHNLLLGLYYSILDGLDKDMIEAAKFRDDLRLEVKDWEKKFLLMQKERQKTLSESKRELKEKQDMYSSIDTYLLRSGHDRKRFAIVIQAILDSSNL